ncbi:uncharacterized protein LOC129941103 [Eupeodes corollae]|uniref:uncharacterized protein LOC129941103 n=1 Tax=Eupeodes corollae TaxID=290404 RepID=UPI00249144EB|nr:uncharacterized protein LOC129941103 [Eupeodes corollae]
MYLKSRQILDNCQSFGVSGPAINMNIFGLVFAVFALLAVLGIADSVSTVKPVTRKPSTKPTTRKPISILTTSRPKPVQTVADCTEFKYCTNFIQPIWATDANKQSCEVFRNRCHFLNNNCRLLLENEKALNEATQEICKPLCKECVTEFNFVCGEMNSEKRKMFLSECDMKNYACKTGETYLPQPDLSLCNAQVIQNYSYFDDSSK